MGYGWGKQDDIAVTIAGKTYSMKKERRKGCIFGVIIIGFAVLLLLLSYFFLW